VYNGSISALSPAQPRHASRRARAEAVCPPAPGRALRRQRLRRKGLATAIDAFARSADRESRLLVVGKGDTRPYRAVAARAGVGQRIAWLGARPDPERWYAAADLVVLPSRYEPFGNVQSRKRSRRSPRRRQRQGRGRRSDRRRSQRRRRRSDRRCRRRDGARALP